LQLNGKALAGHGRRTIKTIQTKTCHALGHPEFRVAVEESLIIEEDIVFALQTLEGMVQEGQRFRDGETVQMGWCILKVRRNEDGTLTLLEPDFVHMPIVWVDSVTSALSHLRCQKDVVESFFDSTELSFPSLRHSCICCTRLSRVRQLLLDRHDPKDSDSGWVLCCSDDDHDHEDPQNLEKLSLYEAALHNRSIIEYLALPPGVLLQETFEGLEVLFHGGRQIEPRKGSYIDALARCRPTSR
jgi:hypothetical protein